MSAIRLIAAALVSGLLALSAPPVLAELPPQAQEALQKGKIAAQQQDYPQAIGYFQDARQAAPEDPEILGDLGLAESKIPGRELRSIAWFGAYLAARPNAPNAAAVKELITSLDVKAASNRNRLIRLLWDAYGALPGDKSNTQDDVPGMSAMAGDMTAAMDMVNRMSAPDDKVVALIQIADAQTKSGDRSGARRTLLLAQRTPLVVDNSRLEYVAQGQVAAGDVAGALSSAALIVNPVYRLNTLCDIAKAQAEARDIAGARATIATALGALDLLKNSPGQTQSFQTSIAKLQVKIGDKEGAKQTLSAALITISRVADYVQPGAWRDVAITLAMAGDFDRALQVAKQIVDHRFSDIAFSDIAEYQVASEDAAGAERTEGLIQDPSIKHTPSDLKELGRYMAAQAAPPATTTTPAQSQPAPSPPRVSEWLGMLDNSTQYDASALNTELFLDPSGALDRLRSTSNPVDMLNPLRTSIFQLTAAQNIIRAMLARQAGVAGQR